MNGTLKILNEIQIDLRFQSKKSFLGCVCQQDDVPVGQQLAVSLASTAI